MLPLSAYNEFWPGVELALALALGAGLGSARKRTAVIYLYDMAVVKVMCTAVGMLTGVLAYAEFTPGLDDGYTATASGVITLPQASGIGMGWWAAISFAALALGAWGMARLEARFAHLLPRA